MPDKSNGWLVKYLVGTLVTLIVFIAIPTLANNMIKNDRMSLARDDKIKEKHNDDMHKIDEKFETIMVSQATILTEIKYLQRDTR